MMASKRSHDDLDPDYEDVSELQNKRQRVIEEGAKQATKKKISGIIKRQFEMEINNKETEMLNISEKLEVAKSMMDRLRACIIANFYGSAGQQKSANFKNAKQSPVIHPTVRKYLGKAPPGTPSLNPQSQIKQEKPDWEYKEMEFESERIGKLPTLSLETQRDRSAQEVNAEQFDSRSGRFKVKKRIIVGNVSKSIPADQRDENDQATHKWMVYVRGPKDSPSINDFVKKVWFFLHPSYRPNDLVEISQPPFHLTRRGWGEFPVRVQLHFRDPRNKKIDIIHNLKLDRTYTGLQTLGSETVVDIEIEKEVPKGKKNKSKTSKVKQEVDVSDAEINSSTQHVPFSVAVKQEPADTGYEKAACLERSGICSVGSVKVNKTKEDEMKSSVAEALLSLSSVVTAVTNSVLIAQNPLQTVVSPSGISKQPLTLIPVGSVPQNAMPKLVPVTPPKTSLIQLQAVSPVLNIGVSSPGRNIVLKGMGALTASSVAGSSNMTSNMPVSNLVQLSPVKSPSSKGGQNLIVSQPFLLTNCSGNQLNPPQISPVFSGNQTKTQTGLQVPSPQQKMKAATSVNQSANSNLVFLKCTDNQGKTYLIPQQIGTAVTSLPVASNSGIALPKGHKLGQVRVAAPGTGPLLLTTNIMASKVVPQSQSSHSPAKVVTSGQNTVQISASVSGPILFVKPDSVNRPNLAVVKSQNIPQANGGKMSTTVQGALLKQAANPGNAKTLNQSVVVGSGALHLVKHSQVSVGNQSLVSQGKQSIVSVTPAGKQVAGSSQSLLGGQLKVTSQGLIKVQGHSPQQNKVSQNSQSEQSILLNGGTSGISPSPNQKKQQPLILVPAAVNSKVDLLQANKGKSLLNMPLQVSQSNASVLLLNQSNIVAANGDTGNIVIATQGISKMTSSGTSILAKSPTAAGAASAIPAKPMRVVQTPQQNHLIIIPVTSQSAVSMVTKGQPSVTSQNSVKLNLPTGNIKTDSKSMLVVVQNEQSAKIDGKINQQGQKTMTSLLGSRSLPSTLTLTSTTGGTPITITSSDSKEKKIIVINEQESFQGNNLSGLSAEKKIMLDPKKKRLMKLSEVKESKEKETIPELRLEDYPDMLSLMRAALKRHPIVSSTAGRHLHPYCANSSEEWLSWNIGKRRASEWQRASAVRKFILSYLDTSHTYKEETVWTVKQILTWCRLHAYSPHYLEKPLHPTAIDLQAETSLPSEKQYRKFTSVTNGNSIVQEVTSLQGDMTSFDSSDDDIDVLSLSTSGRKNKPIIDIVDVGPSGEVETLPPSEGSVFVQKMMEKLGIKLKPLEVEPGLYSTVTHSVIYKAMEMFMGDILKETFALKVNLGRYPDALGISDVYTALNNLPMADFLTNKHLGVEENRSIPTLHR